MESVIFIINLNNFSHVGDRVPGVTEGVSSERGLAVPSTVYALVLI